MQNTGYNMLVKDSQNLGKSKDMELKNIRNNRKNVHNVDNYVDKYVNSYKFCGLKL